MTKRSSSWLLFFVIITVHAMENNNRVWMRPQAQPEVVFGCVNNKVRIPLKRTLLEDIQVAVSKDKTAQNPIYIQQEENEYARLIGWLNKIVQERFSKHKQEKYFHQFVQEQGILSSEISKEYWEKQAKDIVWVKKSELAKKLLPHLFYGIVKTSTGIIEEAFGFAGKSTNNYIIDDSDGWLKQFVAYFKGILIPAYQNGTLEIEEGFVTKICTSLKYENELEFVNNNVETRKVLRYCGINIYQNCEFK